MTMDAAKPDDGRGWFSVKAPARLHFGLLTASPGDGSTAPRPTARLFGGVGLTIDAPATIVRVRRDAAWKAEGPSAARALAFAQVACQAFGIGPCHVVVDSAAPEHVGLGSGTQLALATASAVAGAFALSPKTSLELATILGRGRRSGIGLGAFQLGGFLVDAGKRDADALPCLAVRVAFPLHWKIVLVLPRGLRGLHGDSERQAFADLMGHANFQLDYLSRLVLLGMLPAIQEFDLDALGEALYEFNRRVGEEFQAVQGGVYAHPQTAAVAALLRQQGITGIGQSSWGPATFAIVAEDKAAWVVDLLKRKLAVAEDEVMCTAANNTGAIK
jgi:beta-RFAP synthase